MSSQDSSLTILQVIDILQSSWIKICCTAAASALVIFDHLSTLPREVNLIWRRKLSPVAILFHLNRWTLLVWAALNFTIAFFPILTQTSCMTMTSINSVLDTILMTVWACFSAIRVYAVSGRSWWMAIVVGLLSMAPVAINMYQFFKQEEIQEKVLSFFGPVCVVTLDITGAKAINFDIRIRLCFIAADIFVLAITFIKTYALIRDAERRHVSAPFATILWHNGVGYFVAMLCFHVVNIVCYVLSESWPPAFYFASIFLNPVVSITISRFHLALRRMVYDLDSVLVDGYDIDPRNGGRDSTQLSSIRFASQNIDSVEECL
ncbi:hypothetical protein OBBRIDRAFT_795996, partial [Obba rivulosa]